MRVALEDVAVIRVVPESASPGSVKPATLFLSCDANSDNFEIAAAVAVVALPVCSLISRSFVVRRVTSAAEPAC